MGTGPGIRFVVVPQVAAKLVNVVSFVAVLWSISPSLVVFLVIYSLITTIVTTLIFGERLEKLELKSRITEVSSDCSARSAGNSRNALQD